MLVNLAVGAGILFLGVALMIGAGIVVNLILKAGVAILEILGL